MDQQHPLYFLYTFFVHGVSAGFLTFNWAWLFVLLDLFAGRQMTFGNPLLMWFFWALFSPHLLFFLFPFSFFLFPFFFFFFPSFLFFFCVSSWYFESLFISFISFFFLFCCNIGLPCASVSIPPSHLCFFPPPFFLFLFFPPPMPSCPLQLHLSHLSSTLYFPAFFFFLIFVKCPSHKCPVCCITRSQEYSLCVWM